jgi:hypothetical protein
MVGARMVDDIGRRLRFANAQRERVGELVARHLQLRDASRMKKGKLRRLLADPLLDELLVLCRADALAGSGDVSHLEYIEHAREELGASIDLPPPLLTGDDLRAAGVPPGPLYGRVLQRARDMQLEGMLRDRDDALAQIARLVSEAADDTAEEME